MPTQSTEQHQGPVKTKFSLIYPLHAFGWPVVVCPVVGLPLMPFGVLIPLVSIASITDLKSRKIPNWLNYSAFILAIVFASVFSLGGSAPSSKTGIDLTSSLIGFTSVFATMLVIYSTIGIGAGDVKLAGVIGACVGLQSGLMIVFWAFLTAGLAVSVVAIWKIGPLQLIRKTLSHVKPTVFPPANNLSLDLSYPVPMAVFFAIGTVLTLLEVPLP